MWFRLQTTKRARQAFAAIDNSSVPKCCHMLPDGHESGICLPDLLFDPGLLNPIPNLKCVVSMVIWIRIMSESGFRSVMETGLVLVESALVNWRLFLTKGGRYSSMPRSSRTFSMWKPLSAITASTNGSRSSTTDICSNITFSEALPLQGTLTAVIRSAGYTPIRNLHVCWPL